MEINVCKGWIHTPKIVYEYQNMLNTVQCTPPRCVAEHAPTHASPGARKSVLESNDISHHVYSQVTIVCGYKTTAFLRMPGSATEGGAPKKRKIQTIL